MGLRLSLPSSLFVQLVRWDIVLLWPEFLVVGWLIVFHYHSIHMVGRVARCTPGRHCCRTVAHAELTVRFDGDYPPCCFVVWSMIDAPVEDVLAYFDPTQVFVHTLPLADGPVDGRRWCL